MRFKLSPAEIKGAILAFFIGAMLSLQINSCSGPNKPVVDENLPMPGSMHQMLNYPRAQIEFWYSQPEQIRKAALITSDEDMLTYANLEVPELQISFDFKNDTCKAVALSFKNGDDAKNIEVMKIFARALENEGFVINIEQDMKDPNNMYLVRGHSTIPNLRATYRVTTKDSTRLQVISFFYAERSAHDV